MAPLKRKRPHEDPDPPPPTSSTTTTAAAAPTPTAAAVAGAADLTRRATRQTPILPPPIPTSQSQAAAAEDKRRRSSASTNPRPQLHKISETPIPIPVPPSSSSSTTAQSAGQNPPAVAAAAAAPEPRASRRKSGTAADTTAAMGAAVKEAKENVRPVTLVAPKITYQASQPTPHRTGGSLVRPSPPTSQPPITSHFRPVARQPYHHGIPATVTHVPVPVPPTSTPKQQQQQQQQPPPPQQHTPAPPKPTPSKPQPQTHTQTHTKPQTQTTQAQTSTPRAVDKSAPRTDRNIDKVILGNICFRAWYPSYYGKEVLGDASVSGKSGAATAGTTSGKNPPAAGAGDGAKNQHRKGADTPILDRLYVCPVCFKYSKELVAWWGHVRMCERAGAVPGRKVYTHPRGRRLVRKEMPRQGGKKGNVAARFTEEVVTDEGEWSVWEVDGEQDVLFCQNLSLFAKLFLDNKSVFFDVRGFNYFLLVYTPPPPKPDPAATPAATADQQQQPPRPHIVGFFSKEKMSWDNNNLACILVFPPWQRKGLGALLMGVSYEISRREGVLGGPEKPISELGRKGYKRFWGGEIARWLLGCGTNETNNGEVERELLVDVEDCCKATWIALEDCLITLREMGVVVEGGTGPGKPPAKRKRQGPDGEEGEDEDVEMEDAGEEAAEKPDVPRVRVDKEAVWAWVQANKISLEKVCDPDGFAEGYAIKEVEEDDDEE